MHQLFFLRKFRPEGDRTGVLATRRQECQVPPSQLGCLELNFSSDYNKILWTQVITILWTMGIVTFFELILWFSRYQSHLVPWTLFYRTHTKHCQKNSVPPTYALEVSPWTKTYPKSCFKQEYWMGKSQTLPIWILFLMHFPLYLGKVVREYWIGGVWKYPSELHPPMLCT